MKPLKAFDVQFVGLKLGAHIFEYDIEHTFFEHFEYDEFNDVQLKTTLKFQKKTTLLELDFEIAVVYIDGDAGLEKLYGHEVPVIHIDGEHHDFFKVDPVRFRSSLEKHRQRR